MVNIDCNKCKHKSICLYQYRLNIGWVDTDFRMETCLYGRGRGNVDKSCKSFEEKPAEILNFLQKINIKIKEIVNG